MSQRCCLVRAHTDHGGARRTRLDDLERLLRLSMAVYIFLDIDGVLLPFPKAEKSSCGAIFPDANLEAFFHLLAQVPDHRVILSSTWRVQPSFVQDILESLRLYAYTYGTVSVDFFDKTDPTCHTTRDDEIVRWLDLHPEATEWLALDDEDLMSRENAGRMKGHVVHTESHVGLTMNDVEHGLEQLRLQRHSE